MIIPGQFPPSMIIKRSTSPVYSFSPYDIIYLPNGCEANAITFVLPSNNKQNVEPIHESPKSRLGFNRSYTKIDNYSLMQSLNI